MPGLRTPDHRGHGTRRAEVWLGPAVVACAAVLWLSSSVESHGGRRQPPPDPSVKAETAPTSPETLLDEARFESALRAYHSRLEMLESRASTAPDDEDLAEQIIETRGRIGEILVEQGFPAEANRQFDIAIERARRLSDAVPESRSRLYLLNEALLRRERFDDGDPGRRIDLCTKVAGGARRMMETHPLERRWRRQLAVALDLVTDASIDADRMPEARTAIDEAVVLWRAGVAEDPHDTLARDDLSVALVLLGRVRAGTGRPDEAMAAFEENLRLRRELVAADPRDLDRLLRLIEALNRIGEAARARGNRGAALDACRERRDLAAALYAARPENRRWQALLRTAHEDFAELKSEQGDAAAAKRSLKSALDMSRRLVSAVPNHVVWRRRHAAILRKLGNLEEDAGEPSAALTHYRESRAVRIRLFEENPGDPVLKLSVALIELDVGDVHLTRDAAAACERHYARAVELIEALVAADPRSTDRLADLAYAMRRSSIVALARGDVAVAEARLAKGRKSLEEVASRRPDDAWTVKERRLYDDMAKKIRDARPKPRAR